MYHCSHSLFFLSSEIIQRGKQSTKSAIESSAEEGDEVDDPKDPSYEDSSPSGKKDEDEDSSEANEVDDEEETSGKGCQRGSRRKAPEPEADDDDDDQGEGDDNEDDEPPSLDRVTLPDDEELIRRHGDPKRFGELMTGVPEYPVMTEISDADGNYNKL